MLEYQCQNPSSVSEFDLICCSLKQINYIVNVMLFIVFFSIDMETMTENLYESLYYIISYIPMGEFFYWSKKNIKLISQTWLLRKN